MGYNDRLAMITTNTNRLNKKNHLNMMKIIDRCTKQIMSECEYAYWCRLIAKEEEEQIHIIRFKKTFNRFIGSDDDLRLLFQKLLQDLEANNVHIQISNNINSKLARLIF